MTIGKGRGMKEVKEEENKVKEREEESGEGGE